MRVDPFFGSARYVVDMDRKREKSLAYVTNLTVEERDNTLQRIAENRNIVGAGIATGTRRVVPDRARADGDRGAVAGCGRGRTRAFAAAAADQRLRRLILFRAY